ncbi:hypothetical protein [Streptomyces sp. NPDC051162]|uniref:hypothetical protein n=1 Tax=Streptomyces sp. NPDC051162 TaxID=3154747 RepID=UPI003426BDB8
MSTMHPKGGETLVSKLSSNLLDISRLRGEVTPGGPEAVTHDHDGGQYSMQHEWSVWKLPADELKQGFQRLHDELPRQGWRITQYGPANSEARQLEINAMHEKDNVSVYAELLIRSERKSKDATKSKTDLIHFSVSSPTYRAPEGVDPNKY